MNGDNRKALSAMINRSHCSAIDNPEGELVEFRDERIPKSAWTFDYNIRLKPYNWREKAR